MRERINDKSRLEHILNSIETIQSNKDRFTFEQLIADPIAYYGFVKCVEIIGEAVYMLSKEFRSIHPEVEWNVIENMRHVLVHGYYAIRPEQLWETTMDFDNRILKQITLEDSAAADEIFTILMGDKVPPRKAFIEENAVYATLDI